MHRILAFCVFLALVGAAPGLANAGVRTERRAHAFFLLPERGGVRPFLFVSAGEISASFEAFAIGRGVCRGDAIPDDCRVTRARVFVGELRPGDAFDIDPALGSAYLKITRKGVTHEVSWTANDDVAPVTTAYPCGPLPAAATGAGAVRPAVASGTVFGRPVTAASADGGFGSLSVQAFGC